VKRVKSIIKDKLPFFKRLKDQEGNSTTEFEETKLVYNFKELHDYDSCSIRGDSVENN
jgi:hypothetical protein